MKLKAASSRQEAGTKTQRGESVFPAASAVYAAHKFVFEEVACALFITLGTLCKRWKSAGHRLR